MKPWLRNLLIGVIAYGVFLLWTLPARLVYEQLNEQLAPLRLNAVSGSIWQGRAGYAQYENMDLGALSWQFQPFGLFTGNISFAFNTEAPSINLDGNVAFGAGNSTRYPYLRGNASAAKLQPLMGQNPAQLTGELTFELNQLTLTQTGLAQGTGQAVWTDAGISSPIKMQLGAVLLELDSKNGASRINFSDQEGHLDLDGTVSITSTGQYSIDGKLRPTSSADPNIKNTLNLIGRPDQSGTYAIRYSGRL